MEKTVIRFTENELKNLIREVLLELSLKDCDGSKTDCNALVHQNLKEYLDKNMLKARKNIKDAVDDWGHKWASETEDGKEIIKNEWMIHFSEIKNATNIASNGFIFGNSYDKDTEQATYHRVKAEGGYNYAYLATDVLQYWKDGGQTMGMQPFKDYLMNERQDSFVMFKGNGFRFYHDGDMEEQVVFNSIQPGTKVLIMHLYGSYCVMNSSKPSFSGNVKTPIQKGEGGSSLGNPKNHIGNILYHSVEIEKVIKWVMTNYEQYRKQFSY